MQTSLMTHNSFTWIAAVAAFCNAVFVISVDLFVALLIMMVGRIKAQVGIFLIVVVLTMDFMIILVELVVAKVGLLVCVNTVKMVDLIMVRFDICMCVAILRMTYLIIQAHLVKACLMILLSKVVPMKRFLIIMSMLAKYDVWFSVR